MSKLQLNKEKISELSKNHANQIVGGASTVRKFTCSWCTSDQSHTEQPSRPECDCGGNPNAPATGSIQ